MKNVLVIFGGESCEHDVSVITGVMSINAIDKTLYNPIPIYVGKNGKWYTDKNLNDVSIFKNIKLEKLKEVVLLPSNNVLYLIKNNKLKEIASIYSAVNCCHGGEGEGGGIYSVLKQSNIPCTSSEGFSSSLAMDKEFTKIVLNGLKINCLPCVRVNRENFYLKKEITLKLVKIKIGFPAIIKPSRLGSSIGITVAKNEDELERGLTIAFAYDNRVIVEKALTKFREINCAVYKSGGEIKVSECEEPLLAEEILTFDDKYKLPVKKNFPAEIDESISDKIKRITFAIYKRLKFSGVIRIDYVVQGDEVFVNEINSIPGSLAYYFFCTNTEEFSSFLTGLIEESVDDMAIIQTNKTTFESGVLNLNSCKTKR